MSKENEPKDLSAENRIQDKVEGNDSNAVNRAEISRQDMAAYNKQSKNEPNDTAGLNQLDLTLSISKNPKFQISANLPISPQSSQLLRPSQEYKIGGGIRPPISAVQFLGRSAFGLPFQQLLKSEYKADKSTFEEQKLQPLIDNFLTDTAPREQKNLTSLEREQLAKNRHSIENSHTAADLLSNALHLSRLYQHLRYIEEAKKAASLALFIDPENVLGKQLFSELERMHPADLGRTAFATTNGENLLSKAQLRKRILEFSKGRIMVVGDLLIDELQEGRPVRISREAPVLILEHVVTELIPGGAANTAHNIAAFNATCHAVGLCGKDEYAQKLAQVLEKCQIKHSLVADESRPTTVKTRILSKSHSQMQQLLRLDRISHEPTSIATSMALVEKIKSEASNYQAIILSDYRAGVITDGVIEACRQIAKKQNLMVIVDAQEGFERFSELTIMTPNQPDTEKAVGYAIETREDLKKAGLTILNTTGLEALLVTRGGDGMVLFQKGKEMVELPAFNRSDVFDVTGAGDTVVATMALALVTGASFVEAMALGNLAAGIVVRKAGTAVTNQRELLLNLDALDIPE